jgi:hypothetical protein
MESKKFSNLSSNYKKFLQECSNIFNNIELNDNLDLSKLNVLHKSIEERLQPNELQISDINHLIENYLKNNDQIINLQKLVHLRNYKIIQILLRSGDASRLPDGKRSGDASRLPDGKRSGDASLLPDGKRSGDASRLPSNQWKEFIIKLKSKCNETNAKKIENSFIKLLEKYLGTWNTIDKFIILDKKNSIKTVEIVDPDDFNFLINILKN